MPGAAPTEMIPEAGVMGHGVMGSWQRHIRVGPCKRSTPMPATGGVNA